jgi:hypothetical protein
MGNRVCNYENNYPLLGINFLIFHQVLFYVISSHHAKKTGNKIKKLLFLY